MLSCQQITELASKQLEGKLTFKQRLECKLHLWLCKNCHCYVEQLNFMQKFVQNLDSHHPSPHLSDAARDRIQAKINQAQEDKT